MEFKITVDVEEGHTREDVKARLKDVLRKTENIDEHSAFNTLRSLETVQKVYQSEDLVEGASSFTKKEIPKWKGK